MSNRSRVRASALAALLGLSLAACGGTSQGADTPDPAHGETDKPGDVQGAAAPGEAETQPLEEKRARCATAIEHVIALVEAEGNELSVEDRELALGEGGDACAVDATSEELDCVLAAEALDDVARCEGP